MTAFSGDPAWPALTAGVISLAGGWAKEGGWPASGGKAVIGTAGLVLVFSAAGRTPLRPVATALAWLVLLGAVYGAVPALTGKKTVKPPVAPATGKTAATTKVK